MTVTLKLGNITFSGFEIPERINFGGSQRIAIHRIVGAGRHVQALGSDPDDVSWGGRFRGGDAFDRALSLDQMRRTGTPIDLSWDQYNYSVIISRFEAVYERSYEIPYRITCVPVPRPAKPASSTTSSLVKSDFLGLGSALGGITGAISDAKNAIGGALADVQNAVTGALAPLAGPLSDLTSNLGQAGSLLGQFGSLTGLSVGQLAPLTTVLNQVQGGFGGIATIASGNIFSGIGQVGGILPGSPAGGLPAILTQVANLQTTADSLVARGTAARLKNNLSKAGALS